MRIPVTEDDWALAQFVRKGLTEERYAVDVASDGEQGLQPATEYLSSLILGVMLPVAGAECLTMIFLPRRSF